jgi:hypothetical protein
VVWRHCGCSGVSEIVAPSTIVDPGAAWTVARRSRTAQFRSLRTPAGFGAVTAGAVRVA